MNIGILGIGGVGGYFGGRLAAHYHNSDAVKIIFIARPETADTIRTQGLKLTTPEGAQQIRPHLVVSGGDEAVLLDVLLCATKSYDLEEALKPLASCLTADTLILPLLNGVNAGDTIRSLFPAAQVADGCVYVNAKRLAPGLVEKTGAIEKLYFGSATLPKERLEGLQQVLLTAGIDSHLSANIETDVWTKFVFTAGMATATSYFDEPIGAVLSHPEHRTTLEALVREAQAVAAAKGIQLTEDIVLQTIRKMEGLPSEGTSSMHRDFRQGGRTEFRSLTQYIANLGDVLNIETPVFDSVIAGFISDGRITESQLIQPLQSPAQTMMHFDHYTIRLLTEDDLDNYYNLIDRNRARLEDFFAGTVALTRTPEDTGTHVKDVIAKCAGKKHYPFVVTDDENGALFASIQIKSLDWTIPKAEIGYYVDAAYEGKGIISRAVSKVIAYGFEELGLAKIFIRTHESNIGSRKVAEKNGLIYEGTIRRDYKMTNGMIIDTMYYGILSEEYRSH